MKSMERWTGLLAVAVLTAVVAEASADTITFDPDGPGPLAAQSVGGFKLAPGNVLADGVPQAASGSFTVFYQTRVESISDPVGQPLNTPGLNQTFELTVVGQVDVTFNASGGVIAFDGLVPGSNRIRMFYDDNLLDDPSGTGASALGGTGFFDGREILEARVDQAPSGQITSAPQLSPTDFDQHSSNAFPGQKTLFAAGGVDVSAMILDADPEFFQTPGIVRMMLDVGFTAPFLQTDPSVVFNDGAVTPVLGTVNGMGEDIQLQSDGIASFLIPEPTAAGLLAVASLGLIGRRRHR